MLSSIGRAAIRRTGARALAPTDPVRQGIWQLKQNGQPEFKAPLSAPACTFRAFATATKSTTKPATTKAQKPSTKATKAPVKKPKKKIASKAKPKPKAKPKAKKPAKQKKRGLTDLQKIHLERRKKATQLIELKALALSAPKPLPHTAWQVFLTETNTLKGPSTLAEQGEKMKNAGVKFRDLSPAELEFYNHKANEAKSANLVEYKKWVQSFTPDQIRLANNARRMLNKRISKPTRLVLIHDDRIPKRPANANGLFLKDRYASGDFKGIPMGESMKLVMAEWAALPPAEKKVYEDRRSAESQRYQQEFKTVFNHEPGRPVSKATA
ncbi:HMG-box [Glarea lozoyensis ATCC 20868]|uniref:HMG-box n=2 Tax=Glarea lozoyensis TaxID=101852 RepID=S3DYZ5_GLAL2|nr:HMG-box [Glarea lozoyensis ATCC 20868]EPE31573.1 HMG-box [Glarea lozoyensis ATCC 20868]